MKYNVGDKVRIKSISDIGKLIDNKGYVANIPFGHAMNLFCGNVMTINWVYADCYTMIEDLKNYYCDEMIECKIEEEIKPKFKTGDRVFNKVTSKWVNIIKFDINTGLYIVRYDDGLQGRSLERELTFEDEEETKSIDFTIKATDTKGKVEVVIPEGYGYVVENDKLYFITKKKEYPKTYEECCKVLGYSGNYNMILTTDVDNKLFNTLYRLKVCRDAYWKIAGEKMGLGKPWKPDWEDEHQEKYIIGSWLGTIQGLEENFVSHPFAFPTEEMRDAFKENFDPDIEICKELL